MSSIGHPQARSAILFASNMKASHHACCALLGLMFSACAFRANTRGTDSLYKVNALHLGLEPYELGYKWPAEKEILERMGPGVLSVSDYGYTRSYTKCLGCELVKFYFESDDLLGRPASSIRIEGLNTDHQARPKTDYFSYELAPTSITPRKITRSYIRGVVTYDMYSYEVEKSKRGLTVVLHYD